MDFKFQVKSIYPRAGAYSTRRGKTTYYAILIPSVKKHDNFFEDFQRLSGEYIDRTGAWHAAWRHIEQQMLERLMK